MISGFLISLFFSLFCKSQPELQEEEEKQVDGCDVWMCCFAELVLFEGVLMIQLSDLWDVQSREHNTGRDTEGQQMASDHFISIWLGFGATTVGL